MGRFGKGAGSLGELHSALPKERPRDGLNLPEDLEWPIFPVMCLLVSAWAVLCWPWLSGRVTIPWDAKAHFLPQIQFLAQSIARGESPFWLPYAFSGHPQIADPQSMIFSPPYLALAMLDGNPGLWSADATVFVMVLAGAASLVLWARDQGWHWAAALLTGLAFGFGAAMAWRIQHIGQVLSLVYLVMTLLLLSRALRRNSLIYGLGSGATAGTMLLGRDQVALLGAYFLVAYVAWWLFAGRSRAPAAVDEGPVADRLRRGLVPLSGGAIAGILVVAVPLLLTAVMAGQSNRPAIDLEGAGRGSLHPALIVTLFAPDIFGAAGRMEDYWGPPSFVWRDSGLYIAQNMGIFYMGAVPALLLLLGTASGRLWDRQIRFFTLAAAVTFIYAIGWYTPVFAFLHAYLPGVGLYRRPADALFLLGMLMAILAGYSCHRLLSDLDTGVGRAQVAATVALAVLAFAACLWFGYRLDRLPRTLVPLATAAACFALGGAVIAAALWWKPMRPLAGGLALASFTTADLAWNNGPTTSSAMPSSYYDVLEPGSRNETIAILKSKVGELRSDTRRDRVELLGLGFHWPNASLTHRLENTLGYNPVRLGLYSRATGAEDTVGLPDQRKFTKLFPSFRSPLADLLGLRFIAAGAEIETIDKLLRPGDLDLLARTPDGFVYENRRALPRVLFAPRAQSADFEKMIETDGWPAFDPMQTVLLESPAPDPAVARRPGQVRISSYRNTEVVLEAESPDGGYVVLNDVWHPWWTAEIDGGPAPMVRANVIFRAVLVSPGKHVVRFSFHPMSGLGDTLFRQR